MKNTFSILFYLRHSKLRADGTTPIYVRITIRGKRSDFYSKRSIIKSKWCPKKCRVKGTSEEARILNLYLNTIESKLYQKEQDLLNENKLVTAMILKNEFLGLSNKQNTLISAFNSHIKLMKQMNGVGFVNSTITKYKTSRNHIIDYLYSEKGTSDVLLSELSFSFIASFEVFLRVNKNLSVNTAAKHLIHLKKILNIAVDNEWVLKSPFRNFKVKNEDTSKEFLIESELNDLISTPIQSNRLDCVRDVFAFCCLTGLSYVDVQALSTKDFYIGIDGNKWISIKRKKTGINSKIPLLPHAKEILFKYKDNPKLMNASKILPVISNQKMNKYLKEVAKLCGIQKNLSMHIARHSFATYCLTLGVPLESVSKMLGHRSIKTTQIYAKVIDQKVSDDMSVMMIKAPRLESKIVQKTIVKSC